MKDANVRPLRYGLTLTSAFAVTFAVTFAAEADVDWAKGLVTAEGLGIADRHAPSPAAAREPARRMAEEVARKQLAAQLPALPLATGTLKDKLGDKQVAARLAQVVERAITISATPQTDGSWNVTLAVPLEAVRQAIEGPRKLAAADADPPVIVVEGVVAKPALGYVVGKQQGATLWVKDIPAWAKDAPRVKATGVDNGRIAIPSNAPTGGPSTLFLIARGA